MRFQVKPRPKDGEYRLVKRCALLPIRVQDTWIWLETYWTIDIYLSDRYNGPSWRIDYHSLRKLSKDELIHLLDLDEWPENWRIDS